MFGLFFFDLLHVIPLLLSVAFGCGNQPRKSGCWPTFLNLALIPLLVAVRF